MGRCSFRWLRFYVIEFVVFFGLFWVRLVFFFLGFVVSLCFSWDGSCWIGYLVYIWFL